MTIVLEYLESLGVTTISVVILATLVLIVSYVIARLGERRSGLD